MPVGMAAVEFDTKGCANRLISNIAMGSNATNTLHAINQYSVRETFYKCKVERSACTGGRHFGFCRKTMCSDYDDDLPVFDRIFSLLFSSKHVPNLTMQLINSPVHVVLVGTVYKCVVSLLQNISYSNTVVFEQPTERFFVHRWVQVSDVNSKHGVRLCK